MSQPGSEHAGVLDRQALADLDEMTGGDPEFLAEMIETFLAEAPDQLGAIQAGWRAGNADDVRRNAHSLKASSLTFGAGALAALCEELERAGRQGLPDDLTETLAAMEAAWVRVAAELRQVIPNPDDALRKP